MCKNIFRVMGMMLLLAMCMLSVSCTGVKCAIDKQSCKWDCPETIGLSQACEQKCNVLYDICRSKK
ncbi:MAG: hypothetical protein K4571_20365 [Deltaproteobacteria bacterium]